MHIKRHRGRGLGGTADTERGGKKETEEAKKKRQRRSLRTQVFVAPSLTRSVLIQWIVALRLRGWLTHAFHLYTDGRVRYIWPANATLRVSAMTRRHRNEDPSNKTSLNYKYTAWLSWRSTPFHGNRANRFRLFDRVERVAECLQGQGWTVDENF